jgi:tRNA(fMet)-specific endonuclease VapC
VIVAGYFNRDAAIHQRLTGQTVYVASITMGELYFGAYRSQRVAQNVQNIRQFAALTTVLPCTEVTGDWYGQIKAGLRAKGRPIPDNDIWIAAVAMHYGLILATRDSHFHEVGKLSVEMW